MRIAQPGPLKPAIASVLVLIALYAHSAAKDKIVFVDVTSELHLTLQPIHNTRAHDSTTPITLSAYSREFALQTLVPEMGGSIAIGHDGESKEYLYVTIPGGHNHLFESTGGDSFSDVTAKARVLGDGNSLSATFADYDHSGHPSLFVVGGHGITLYHNNGNGSFTDVTQSSGLKNRPGELDTCALLIDIDNDGFSDLFVTTYTDLDAPPSKISFLFPGDFHGAFSHLYRNLRNGTFADITTAAYLKINPGRTRKALAADFDNDGYLDLLLLRDDKPPVLLMNQQNASFRDATWDVGDIEKVWKYAFLDAQVADFDRDGNSDLALWSPVISSVLWNRGGTFIRSGSPPAITQPNNVFGFFGTVLDLHDNSDLSLLTVDDHYTLHLLSNQKGSFAETPIELYPKPSPRERNWLQTIAFAVATRLPSSGSGKLVLLTLSFDGKIRAFERRP
jgi:VCBS repeat protein